MYIYMCVCVCVCIHIYIYIYIHAYVRACLCDWWWRACLLNIFLQHCGVMVSKLD